MTAREEIDALMATVHAAGGTYIEEQRRHLIALIPIERRETEQASHSAALTASTFKPGDRVLHRSRGSAKRGADARVGVVRRVYTSDKGHGVFVAKLSVDWPAPRRIGGDGWHRSDVIASAVIAATDEEVERRRALNRTVNAANQARWNAENEARCNIGALLERTGM